MNHFCKIKQPGFTLIEILVVVLILAALAAMIIPNALRARMNANDVMAQATLKTIAAGMENFLVIEGNYPTATDELVNLTPPYINKDFFAGTHAGFIYGATLASYAYTLTASPVDLGKTGSTTYTITTGGIFQ